jgi:hypothetical protein
MTSARSILHLLVGLNRIFLGAVLLTSPGFAARTWLGANGEHPGTALLFRSIGARDVALGAGLLTAEADDTSWSRAGTVADACDVVGSLLALGAVPARRLMPGTLLAAFVAAGIALESPGVAVDRRLSLQQCATIN